MKKLILAVTALLAFQDKKPPEKPKTAAVELQRDILKEQLAEKQIQSEFQACQARQWSADFNTHQLAIQKLTDDAFKQAGLDKKDWDLNLDTFEFAAKAKK